MISSARPIDLEEGLRERALAALQAAPGSASWVRLVSEVAALETADQARALGDTLPVGLKLE